MPQGILCKPPKAEVIPAPPSAVRRAVWEEVLHLKPGDLAPARVSIRQQLQRMEESKAIKAALAADDSQAEV